MQRVLNTWHGGEILPISGASLAEVHTADSRRSTASQFSNSSVRNEPEFDTTTTTISTPPLPASAHVKRFPWPNFSTWEHSCWFASERTGTKQARELILSCSRACQGDKQPLLQWTAILINIPFFLTIPLDAEASAGGMGISSRCLKRKAKKKSQPKKVSNQDRNTAEKKIRKSNRKAEKTLSLFQLGFGASAFSEPTERWDWIWKLSYRLSSDPVCELQDRAPVKAKAIWAAGSWTEQVANKQEWANQRNLQSSVQHGFRWPRHK